MPNLYTGTANDPHQQAQHNYLGPEWERYFQFLNGKKLLPQSLGIGATRGLLPAPGGEDIARSGAINAYLGDVQDARDPLTNRPLDITEAQLRQMREQSDVKRALAIANDPRTSAQGRPIVGRDGTYETAAPIGEPVNRQAVAAQMAPGLIAPPAAPVARQVTYADPKTEIVNGKPTLTRAGSDGLLYDMARRPIDPSTVQPVDDRKGPLETIIGPDGRPIRVRQEDAIGKEPAAGTMKASTGVQKRVLNFFNRAQQADTELEGLESQIQDLGILDQGRMKFAPNFMQSQLGQSYGAAQRAFTEARLRKDSGAAIPEQEFANDRRTYFAEPGDSKETLEQKRRARGAMLASLGFESGQALGEFVGDEGEAKAIVQGYKDRAAGTKAGGGGGEIIVTDPDGGKHPFATQAQADAFKKRAGIQ